MIKQTHQFPHQRLDAWHLSREARRLTFDLIASLPRGFGEEASQLRRSSGAVPKLIAEGANRWASGDKRRRFEEAEGEIGETAAGLEDLAGLADPKGQREWAARPAELAQRRCWTAPRSPKRSRPGLAAAQPSLAS